jgi:DNA repair protein RecO (recombination protein O)
MFTHYRTEGIVIKKIERGEADLLLVVYTREFGRVEVVARGIRKAASKLRPAIEFTALIEIEFIQGKTCKTLIDAVIINSLGGSRDDLGKSAVLRQICDFTEKAVKDQQADARIWDLLRTTLVFIESAPNKSCGAVRHYFAWHLLEASGWRPEFDPQTAGAENFSLVNIFLNADIVRSSKMRLAARQSDLLAKAEDDYLSLVTK